MTKKPTQTSTPCPEFYTDNLSSIHSATVDESAANIPNKETLEQMQNELNEPKMFKSIKQPVFVATRRPKMLVGKRLTMESCSITQTGDVDDVATVSVFDIVSAMDMSSILIDNENSVQNDAQDDDKSMSASSNSFEITKPETKTEASKTDSIEMTSPKTVETNESSIWLNHSDDKQPTEFNASAHQNDVLADAISVLSTSTTSMAAVTKSIANQPKLSSRPRVGFDASNSIYELSVLSQPHESIHKLVMKSGKWRRTIFEARRNRTTHCEFG